jgi:uncharacterized protein (TIGR02246 family)
MNTATYMLFAATILLPPGLTFAQGADSGEALKASQAQANAYIAAFNKADVKALSSLYAEDAQYTSDDGVTITGRAAVSDGLVKYLAKNKGAKLALDIESARYLTPEVLLEKGIATVGDERTRYAATYVKKDGSWLISELDESAIQEDDAAAQALGSLSWLVGMWRDNSPGIDVQTRVSFTLKQHFLRRSFTVKRADEDPIEGTEVIGFDPVAGQIRSWIFDSEGGFGEGTWRQDGNKWLINSKATAPDGTTSTGSHVVTVIDDKKFTWESINRQSGGEALPNLDKVEVVRTAAQ